MERVLQRISEARLIIIGDVHSTYQPAHLLCEIVGALPVQGIARDGPGTPGMLHLEALPTGLKPSNEKQDQWYESVSRSVENCWPWPAAGVLRLARVAHERGWRVSGFGGCWSESVRRFDEDAERRPIAFAERTRGEVWWLGLGAVFDEISTSAQLPLAKGLVLCGAAHVMALRARALQELGPADVITILPVFPELQLVQAEESAVSDLASWIELAPNLVVMSVASLGALVLSSDEAGLKE
jgi:hypothetical protein